MASKISDKLYHFFFWLFKFFLVWEELSYRGIMGQGHNLAKRRLSMREQNYHVHRIQIDFVWYRQEERLRGWEVRPWTRSCVVLKGRRRQCSLFLLWIQILPFSKNTVLGYLGSNNVACGDPLSQNHCVQALRDKIEAYT